MRHKRSSSASSDSDHSSSRKKGSHSGSSSRTKSKKDSERSRDHYSNDKYGKSIDKMKREKNYEFNFEDLHKSEQGRQFMSEKLDKNDTGFTPKTFISSKSKKAENQKEDNRLKSSMPENLPFEAAVEVNVVNSSSKMIMHESLFEDVLVKEKRWKQSLIAMLKILYKSNEDQGGKVKLLKSSSDLSSFGYFQRGSVEEFLKFTSKILVERSTVGSRSSVKEQDYIAHVFVRLDNLCGIIFSDQEYPKRVAHTLLNKVLEDFSKTIPSSSWPTVVEESVVYNELPQMLAKYQNPKEADALTKLQMDLDETKIILHGTIESVLQRGETLDHLVSKSEDLGLQSKAFYKTAKKTNACCSYM